MVNANSPDAIPTQVSGANVDRILTSEDVIGAETDYDDLFNTRLTERLDTADALAIELEASRVSERRTEQTNAVADAKSERQARVIAEQKRAIGNYQSRIHELESGAGDSAPWSAPLEIVKSLASGRVIAGLAAVVCVLLLAGPVVDSVKALASVPPALVPDALDAERLDGARSTTDPNLGRVRAIGYTYDASRRQALVAICVTPSAESRVDFVAISGAYSSLAVGHAVLKAETAGFAEGSYDADQVVAVWRRAGFSVVDARRAIERDPEVRVAPGKPYIVLLPFKVTDVEAFEQGRWGTLSLVALSSASLAALEPDQRFGKDIEDVAYGVDGETRFAHLGAIRLQVAVPFVPFDESREKTFRLRRPSPATAGV